MRNSQRAKVWLIRKTEYSLKEWKNGNGRSFEIWIYPESSIFPSDAFLFRLSTASIGEGGPFSVFKDYKRYITILEGEEVILRSSDNMLRKRIKRGDVYQFSGDDALISELPSGPITDLNLIYRSEVRVYFETLVISRKPRSFRIEGRMVFLYVVTGALNITIYPGEIQIDINASETSRMEFISNVNGEDNLITIDPKSQDATVVLIDLDWD